MSTIAKKIYIIVEGQTEEKFVKDILYWYFFNNYEIFLQPITIATSSTPQRKYKGGLTKYSYLKKDVLKVINHSDAWKVTTFIDYYGLPAKFPGIDIKDENINVYEKVKILEESFSKDINSSKFIPYIQLHEFETLLFSDIEAFRIIKQDAEVLKTLKNIKTDYDNNPELINDNPKSSPSKRIIKLIPDFKKTIDGLDILEQIGIEKLKANCQHFSEWLSKLKENN